MSVFTIRAITANQPPNAPNVVVESWKKERDYYSGNDESGRSHLNYMKLGSPEQKLENSKEIDTQERVFGIFNESGILTDKTEKTLRNELKSTGSHIWTGIINFETTEGIKHCSDVTQAQTGFKKAFSEFCREANLNKENLSYVASLHENSELYHLHYMFYEKQPKRILKASKAISYSKNFSIDKNAVLKMPKIIDKVFGGLLQENTMKTEKLKKLTQERAGEYNFTSELKILSKSLKTESFISSNIPFENWYSSLEKKTKRTVDKLTVKRIKTGGITEYTNALKEIPKQHRSEFRNKTYATIGARIIRQGLDVLAIEDEKEQRLARIKKERQTYDLSKKEQIDYRLIKKTAKIKTEKAAEEIKGIDIVQIFKTIRQELLKQNNKVLRRK